MSSEGLKVGRARRKSVRDLQSPFGNDFNKYIAEILTNSDDSYKRLEQSGDLDFDSVKTIEIEINEDKSRQGYIISIIDQAEGLTKKRIEEIFTKYGGDNSGGSKVKSRGIFGQGASDVLFNSAYNNFPALIETIKDDVATKTKFYLDENLDRYISPPEELKLSSNRLNQLRKSWGIQSNGTRVTFGVKENVVGRKTEKVINDLENFYSFRYILSSENRKVILKFRKKIYTLCSNKFHFLESERILNKKEFKFNHDKFTTKGDLSLYKRDRVLNDKTTIIIRDNNYVVYANDFFKFDNNTKAKNIVGELILDNIYEVCKHYLNSEEKASAVLTETRDGFNQTHQFYKDLSDAISPIIIKTVEEFGENVKETDMTNNKKFSDALRDVNKYLEKEIEEEIDGRQPGIQPPSDGLRFARPEIFINKGKVYTIPLYINSTIISDGETISIAHDGEEYITSVPTTFYYEKNLENPSKKAIRIESKNITDNPIVLTAMSDLYKCSMLINVIEKDMFYPKDGMEFHSNVMRVKPEQIHTGKLYIDTNLIPLGSEIVISSNEPKIIIHSKIVVEESHIIVDGIAVIKIHYTPKVKDGDYHIDASYLDFGARLDIQVRQLDDPNPGTRGIINGFKFSPGNAFYQSYFQPFEKIIYIMQDNEINKALMPGISEINPEKPNVRKQERKIIADILAHEISILLVNKQIEKGKIAIEENGQDEYLNKIRKEKNKIFGILHRVLE